MLYKTEGIIIKKQNLNDLDRLLTIYTKDYGKILVKAKSVRKNQAKLKGHLELFLLSHLVIAPARRRYASSVAGGPGRGFDIITGAETLENFSSLRKDLSSLAGGYYLAEIIDKLIAGPEKDENIWQLLLGSFESLNQKKDIKGVVNNYENRLLEFLGYGQQKNPLNFVQSLINEEIKSCSFLVNVLK